MKSVKKIPFGAAVLMSINIIVGAGIFFNPKEMTELAGSLSFLGWPLVGLLLFPIIWSLSQATVVFPGEGGFYNYCSTALNKTAGFFAHWAYLIGYIGTAATFCAAIKVLFISQLGLDCIKNNHLIVNLIIVALVSALNLMQLNLITKLQSGAALIKMIPLVFVIALGAFYFSPHLVFPLHDMPLVVSTISVAIFSFLGFEVCCSIGHMVEGGAKQASRAILSAFFIAMSLYMFYHLGLLYIMGVDNLSNLGPVSFPQFLGLSDSLTRLVQGVITFFILFSVINALYGVFLMNVTNLFSLAKNRLIIGSQLLSITNAQDRPLFAIAIHGFVVFLVVTFIPSLTTLMALTSVGVCIAFLMSLVALFVTYMRRNDYLQLTITSLGFISCAVMIYFSWLAVSQDYISRVILVAGLLGGLVLHKLHVRPKVARSK